VGVGREWVSRTPYFAPRLTSPRGKDRLERQVARELVERGLPEPVSVEVVGVSPPQVFRAAHLNRAPPFQRGYELRLVFAEEVSGPVCLGYGAHRGVGVFSVR